MGIMIHDEEIIAILSRLADREGITKAEALRRALDDLEATLPASDEEHHFPRERVEHRTYIL